MQIIKSAPNTGRARFSQLFLASVLLWLAVFPNPSAAMGLMVDLAQANCGQTSPRLSTLPPAATQRLAGSHVAQGQRDIAWAWLGSPTSRYPHTALGSRFHAGSLHVLLTPTANGTVTEVAEIIYRLPFNRVFEDLMVRLTDLDGDGRDEVVVVEADALRGASLVVFKLMGSAEMPTLVEVARSPPAGSTFRWLNPVGFADFDADGKTDIAAVMTPHIGGELTLYHYRPPLLVPYAKAMDTSNHLMGSPEQQLAVIVQTPGVRPTVIVPSMSLKALHALRWEGSSQAGSFRELADAMTLPARIERITPMEDRSGKTNGKTNGKLGACVLLADNTWRVVTLTEKP